MNWRSPWFLLQLQSNAVTNAWKFVFNKIVPHGPHTNHKHLIFNSVPPSNIYYGRHWQMQFVSSHNLKIAATTTESRKTCRGAYYQWKEAKYL